MQAAEFDDFYAASFSRVVHQLYAMTGDGSPEAWVRTTAYRLRSGGGRSGPGRA